MKQITRCFECGVRIGKIKIRPKQLGTSYRLDDGAILHVAYPSDYRFQKYGTHVGCGGYEIKSKPRYINKSIYV